MNFLNSLERRDISKAMDLFNPIKVLGSLRNLDQIDRCMCFPFESAEGEVHGWFINSFQQLTAKQMFIFPSLIFTSISLTFVLSCVGASYNREVLHSLMHFPRDAFPFFCHGESTIAILMTCHCSFNTTWSGRTRAKCAPFVQLNTYALQSVCCHVNRLLRTAEISSSSHLARTKSMDFYRTRKPHWCF